MTNQNLCKICYYKNGIIKSEIKAFSSEELLDYFKTYYPNEVSNNQLMTDDTCSVFYINSVCKAFVLEKKLEADLVLLNNEAELKNKFNNKWQIAAIRLYGEFWANSKYNLGLKNDIDEDDKYYLNYWVNFINKKAGFFTSIDELIQAYRMIDILLEEIRGFTIEQQLYYEIKF